MLPRLINTRDITTVLNNLQRGIITFDSGYRTEGFIVDDVWEQIEAIPTENNGEWKYNAETCEWEKVENADSD